MTTKQKTKLQMILTTAYLEYRKALSNRAYFKVRNHAVSEDLVQDTFMKTWGYLVRGGKIEMMKAFLYNVLNNLIVDEYRKHKMASLDILVEKGFEPSADNSDYLFDNIDGKAALNLINRLPEKYRKVMRMRYIQSLSLKEMSGVIGQTKNTIAVQAHRGLERLKALHDRGL